jgi:DNA ligase-associated metallophosphoesterase
MSAPRSARREPPAQLEIVFAGEKLVLDAAGAIYAPRHDALLVSDLHLEKGSFFAAAGRLVPGYDTAETLTRLAALCDDYRPRTVFCLGDSFHDRGAFDRLEAAARVQLEGLCASCERWVWIAGNHDPEPPGLPACDARVVEHLGAIALVHRPEDAAGPRIAGHYHPRAGVRFAKQHRVSGPCFVVGGEVLLLPAFGAYTGGLDARAPEIVAAVGPARHVMLFRGKLWPL